MKDAVVQEERCGQQPGTLPLHREPVEGVLPITNQMKVVGHFSGLCTMYKVLLGLPTAIIVAA